MKNTKFTREDVIAKAGEIGFFVSVAKTTSTNIYLNFQAVQDYDSPSALCVIDMNHEVSQAFGLRRAKDGSVLVKIAAWLTQMRYFFGEVGKGWYKVDGKFCFMAFVENEKRNIALEYQVENRKSIIGLQTEYLSRFIGKETVEKMIISKKAKDQAKQLIAKHKISSMPRRHATI